MRTFRPLAGTVALALVAAACLCAPGALAAEHLLRLQGMLVQGGLVKGYVPPGSRVRLDGRPVRVRAGGLFLIGFGRNAAHHAVLEVRAPGLPPFRRVLTIKLRHYPTQRIEGLPPKMVTPPPEVIARIRRDIRLVREARSIDTDRPMFGPGFIWPAHGPISGVYGSQRILNGKPRRPHYGVDIAAPKGSPVAAAAAGVVRVAEHDMYFTGGTVVIDHGYGLNSAYSHLRTVIVKPGERVARGQKIGTVGATGRATGPHLDWRVNLFLTRLDPALLVPPMKVKKRKKRKRGR